MVGGGEGKGRTGGEMASCPNQIVTCFLLLA